MFRSGQLWRIRGTAAFAIGLTLAMVLSFNRPAAAAPTNSSIVIDATSGQVLLQSNADAPTFPASLTKMMTLYLLFEAMQKGAVKLDQPLPVSANAASMPATNLALSAGDTITVATAIQAMIIRSANDVAVVVAEGLSGSEAAFAQKMNAKALALGMTQTVFRNPNGLPDPWQHTTARDIATLALALHRDFPQYYPFFAQVRFNFHGRTYVTHNRFMLHYPGADGLKTGYIHLSGFNLAASAMRNGRRIVAVIMGGRSPSMRDAAMWALLDRGFGTATPKTQNNALLLASVVSGDDAYYLEHKAADSSWTPTNDGDRQDVAIALFASADQGASWTFRNVIVGGGWQGGSAGATGVNVAAADTSHEIDPVWEPYLLTYNNKLVAYYSDENDYTAYNATTGALTVAGDNATGPDSAGQILAHKTWDGVSTSWSSAVADVAGNTTTTSTGQSEIGGGRPGMATVTPTADGKWMMTYEYWGGGDNVRYKIAGDPLSFFSVTGVGAAISGLPVASGSRALARGGSPVLVRMPDGRLAYNAAGSGSVWVNAAGTSTGAIIYIKTQIQNTG